MNQFTIEITKEYFNEVYMDTEEYYQYKKDNEPKKWGWKKPEVTVGWK